MKNACTDVDLHTGTCSATDAYGYVWVARMRPFWSPAETVIGGRSGLLRGPGRPSRPLLRPRGWSGATVSIQMGGGGAEDRGLRSVTCMGESSLEY